MELGIKGFRKNAFNGSRLSLASNSKQQLVQNIDAMLTKITVDLFLEHSGVTVFLILLFLTSFNF